MVADKGGVAGCGYTGQFDPASGTWTAVHEFPQEAKVKGGLTRVGDTLWFVCEKGGAANYRYLGSYDPPTRSMTVLMEFPEETKPKTAPPPLDDQGWYFLTDKGGASNLGALWRFETNGLLTVAASFDTFTGMKFEAPPILWQGQVWYAAREGGDLSQMGGKGAGALSIVDLVTGSVVRKLALAAAQHGAKIRALMPMQGKLYYAAEEGGDLSFNYDKGFGGVGWFDPGSGQARLILVCDGPGTGAKPRDLVAVGDTLYFVCAEGGSHGGGTLGRIRDDSVEIVASLEAGTGTKPEALTPWAGRLYFTAELGGGQLVWGDFGPGVVRTGGGPAGSAALATCRGISGAALVGRGALDSRERSGGEGSLDSRECLGAAAWSGPPATERGAALLPPAPAGAVNGAPPPACGVCL